MNLSTPTEFQVKRIETIKNGALLAHLRPQTHLAKRIKAVECLNPKAKLCYEYDRIFRVSFDDGSSIEVSNDYVRRGMKAGGWLVVESGEYGWCYYDDSEFRLKYEI